MWGLILLLKIWGEKLNGKSVVVLCDNQAVAELVNSGRARDEKLQQGLREICFLSAKYQFQLLSRFIEGEQNRLPDLLSRWWKGEKYRKQFRELTEGKGFVRRSVRNDLFYYSHLW